MSSRYMTTSVIIVVAMVLLRWAGTMYTGRTEFEFFITTSILLFFGVLLDIHTELDSGDE